MTIALDQLVDCSAPSQLMVAWEVMWSEQRWLLGRALLK